MTSRFAIDSRLFLEPVGLYLDKGPAAVGFTRARTDTGADAGPRLEELPRSVPSPTVCPSRVLAAVWFKEPCQNGLGSSDENPDLSYLHASIPLNNPVPINGGVSQVGACQVGYSHSTDFAPTSPKRQCQRCRVGNRFLMVLRIADETLMT